MTDHIIHMDNDAFEVDILYGDLQVGSAWHGRNFVVKCEGDSLVWNQYSQRVDAEVTFYTYRFPVLFLEVFWEQHESRFVLADDLHINVLEFVAGNGTVVQPASINIVFGCKQVQQYSRTHQLGFIRAVSWITTF